MTNKDNTMKAIPKVCEILRHKGKKVTKPKLPGLSSPLDAHCKGPKMYEPAPSKFTEKGLNKLKAANIGGEFGRIVDNAVADKEDKDKKDSALTKKGCKKKYKK